MTLQEKFKQWLDTKPRYQIRDVQLEIIAEKFTIEFVDWVIENKILSSKIPTKELLEMYKKTL
jgi:hypothetical protein